MVDDDDVRGLNLVSPGRAESDVMARVRAQLRAADAQIRTELDAEDHEPAACAVLRKRGQDLLADRLYEDAETHFLDALDAGLDEGYLCWQAAVNVVNCQLFLRRLDAADETAAGVLHLVADQPDHPVHYLCATQRGAIAAERWGLADRQFGQAQAEYATAQAHAALAWARQAYDWLVEHRGEADGLRAYNLVVALLRLGDRAAALAIYRRHAASESFQTWCSQGDHAAQIATLETA